MKNKPHFLKLYSSGELNKRIGLLTKNLSKCSLCPRNCKVGRNSKLGFCRADTSIHIAFYKRHFGEEPPISAKNGSGVIFFTNCTARCVYCQNYYFSQKKTGYKVSPKDLAHIMLRFKEWGCHNVNLVSSTQYLPQIVSSLKIAIEGGFDLPLVLNSSGYESLETLKLLDGIIDIYLPDMKYSDKQTAKELSSFKDYVGFNRTAISEMFRQVGSLELDENHVAKRGMIVRHLILPNNKAGTRETLQFISRNLSRDVHVSLMDQYFPDYKAIKFTQINRRVHTKEYQDAIKLFCEFDLQNGWM